MLRSVITGMGSYIPPVVKTNSSFTQQVFYSDDHQKFKSSPLELVEKFKAITGIKERRYTSDELTASDMGAIAAEKAIAESGVNPEELDQLIVAHNFGNIKSQSVQSTAVPSLASVIKNRMAIRNPACIAYDILFGCPGWLQGVIQADAFFKAGIARKALIVGTETLSRVIDKYDRDSMLFADGAGAMVLEYKETGDLGAGILGYVSETHSFDEVDYINMGISFCPEADPLTLYMKMKGRKVYEFAIIHVPNAMKACLDKSKVDISDVKKAFIHQANEKMDEGIIRRLFKLYGIAQPPEYIMPMSIGWLGNSSVATIPTLYDLVRKELIAHHSLRGGDIVLFASVGAGMNLNAVCYRC